MSESGHTHRITNDRTVYSEGFVSHKWYVEQNDTETYLVRRFEYPYEPFEEDQVVCAAPKLIQGKKWLEEARQIARLVENDKETLNLIASLTYRPVMEAEQRDILVNEGLPEGWGVLTRSDATMLVKTGTYPFTRNYSVFLKPKSADPEQWNRIAQRIAILMADEEKRRNDEIWAGFCDECGIGPPVDEHGDILPHKRAFQSFVCEHCEHINARPKLPS